MKPLVSFSHRTDRGAMPFKGFTADTLAFLGDLAQHNDRAWFAENRDRYEREILVRQRDFVEAIGREFASRDARVQAIPTIDRSIYRISRDTRFTPDKSPYKTYADLIFWIGDDRKSSPGYYLRLSPNGLLVGGGAHLTAPDQDQRYRSAVVDPGRGDALSNMLRDLGARGFEISGPTRKTVPKGFSADAPNAELLRHNEFHVVREFAEAPAEFTTEAVVGWTMTHFAEVAPLVDWFADNVGDSHMESTRSRR